MQDLTVGLRTHHPFLQLVARFLHIDISIDWNVKYQYKH